MRRHQQVFLIAVCVALVAVVFTLNQSTHSPTPALAQDDTNACETLVIAAVRQMGSACAELGRNEICYGNTQVSATLIDDTLFFDNSGDIVGVTDLETIITRPADPDTDEWGIAVMDLAADLPEVESGFVRMVMFGDVDIDPQHDTVDEEVPTCQFINTNASNLNMRGGPGLEYQVVDVLDTGTTVTVYGRMDDWVRSSRGWVFSPFATLECAGDPLREVTEPGDTYYAPMQSFTLQITEQGTCQNAPSGMLVQSPNGQAANIMVNNVEIRIGSTAFLTMDDDLLIVANYDNKVSATARSSTTIIPVGAQVKVRIEDGEPVTTPFDLEPISGPALDLDSEMTLALPNPIEVPYPWLTAPIGSAGGGGGGSEPGATEPPPGEEIPGSFSVPPGYFSCMYSQSVFGTGYFNPGTTGATIADFSIESTNENVVGVIGGYISSGTTFEFEVYCYTLGSVPMRATVTDSLDNFYELFFTVEVIY